jgi:hypothetical protein
VTAPSLATDPLLALQLKLPTHTYKAVKRRAEAMDSEDERRGYLEGVLERRERSEATTPGSTQPAVREAI